MKRILAIILAVAMVMSMAVVASADAPETTIVEVTETVTGTFTATFGAEGNWGTEAVVDYDSLSTGLTKSASWVNFNVNVLDLVKSAAPIADVTKLTLNVTADKYEIWERETAGSESVGLSKTLGVSYGVADYSYLASKYNMESDASVTFTSDDLGDLTALTKLTVKPINGKPDSTVTFTVSIDVTYTKEVVVDEGEVPEEPDEGDAPEEPVAADVVLDGVAYDEEVLYTSTTVVDASIEGWGWYNAFEQGTFGSYDAALAALNGTYIKVTHVGSINAPFWQTDGSSNNQTTVFGTANGVTYFNSSVLYDDMVALGDQGWGNIVIAGNGDEAETVAKVEIVTLVEISEEPDEGDAPEAPEEEVEETYRGAGYFMTGDETHAIIIGKAIITSNHVFDADGDCKYCGHHVDVEVDDIIVIQPTESTEEESEDITVTEPKEDTNPGTGLTLAVIPAIVALAAVVISKR